MGLSMRFALHSEMSKVVMNVEAMTLPSNAPDGELLHPLPRWNCRNGTVRATMLRRREKPETDVNLSLTDRPPFIHN